MLLEVCNISHEYSYYRIVRKYAKETPVRGMFSENYGGTAS